LGEAFSLGDGKALRSRVIATDVFHWQTGGADVQRGAGSFLALEFAPPLPQVWPVIQEDGSAV
jgi:hypothetical protein